jgi:chromosomal replication initiation ATPase DnaA
MTGQQVMARLREHDGDGEILQLARNIANHHGVTHDEMLGESHEPMPCAARHHLWYALYMTGKWSYPRIAKTFGRKAHQTVIAGVKSHCEREGLVPPRPGGGNRYCEPREAELR